MKAVTDRLASFSHEWMNLGENPPHRRAALSSSSEQQHHKSKCRSGFRNWSDESLASAEWSIPQNYFGVMICSTEWNEGKKQLRLNWHVISNSYIQMFYVAMLQFLCWTRSHSQLVSTSFGNHQAIRHFIDVQFNWNLTELSWAEPKCKLLAQWVASSSSSSSSRSSVVCLCCVVILEGDKYCWYKLD